MDGNDAIGARIRTFRERAGLQGQELAAALGLDPSAISNIERGKRHVKTDELAKIASALGVSPLSLLGEEALPTRMPIAARAGAGAVAAGSAYRRLLALTELHQILAEAGIGGRPLLEDAPSTDAMDWRTAATQLSQWASRRLEVAGHGDEQFSALASAIEDGLGVDVVVESHPGDVLAGATISEPSFPLVFVNAEQPTPRALFTLAHELGHLLARHGEPIALDETLFGSSDNEKAANLFAAEFLMPETEVRRIIAERGRGGAALAYLMHYFGVSFETLIYRLHGLREINTAGRDRLRSIGLRGLLNALDRDDPRNTVPVGIRKSLAARQGRRPERRSPVWLVERMREGYHRGIVSVRPLAGLLGEDPERVLERERASSGDSDLSFGRGIEDAEEDEGFEASPVE